MRLDLLLPNQGDYLIEAMSSGPHYEEMGWEGLWLSDHLLGVAEDHLHKDGWFEILISMAHLAAQTSRIRIGSGIVVLPYRNPVLTARMVATLDHLSGGRIDFGVGVGWLLRESQALGVGDTFDQRGPYSNEILDIILTCWKGGVVQFKGKWFDVPPVTFEPVPLQHEGRVPIWVGSHAIGGAPMARVAKYADYWHPTEIDGITGRQMTPEMFAETGDRLDELAEREIPRTILIQCNGDPREKVDLLHRFAEAGCVQAACSFFGASPTFADFDRVATRFLELAGSLRDN